MENLDYRSKNMLKVILIGIAIFFTFWYISPILDFLKKFLKILQPFIIGFMVAYIINIPMNFFIKVIKDNYKNPKHNNLIKGVALLLSRLLVLSGAFILLTILIPEIINSALTITNKWPAFIDEFYRVLLNNNITKNYADQFLDFANGIDRISIRDAILVFMRGDDVNMLTFTTDILNYISSSAVSLFTIIVFSIFVLIYKDMLAFNGQKILYAFLSEERADYINEIFSLSYHTFKDYIFSRLISVVMLTALTYFGMVILSIPNAAMISILVGISDLIPIFGPIFAAVLSGGIIFIESPLKALIFLIFDVIIQQVQENIIYPAIADAQIGLPAVWVLASVTIGGSLFGIIGMLVSIPVASIIYTLFHEKLDQMLRDKNIDEKMIEEKKNKNFKVEVNNETYEI